jgi:hypothetical protein
MKSDDSTRRIEDAEEHDENNHVEKEVDSETAEVGDPQPRGWVSQLRQVMQRSSQGEARTNVKRQQLKEDRTKSFLLLAGLTVVSHSLRCSRRPTAERTLRGQTIPILAVERERTRIQAAQ